MSIVRLPSQTKRDGYRVLWSSAYFLGVEESNWTRFLKKCLTRKENDRKDKQTKMDPEVLILILYSNFSNFQLEILLLLVKDLARHEAFSKAAAVIGGCHVQIKPPSTLQAVCDHQGRFLEYSGTAHCIGRLPSSIVVTQASSIHIDNL